MILTLRDGIRSQVLTDMSPVEKLGLFVIYCSKQTMAPGKETLQYVAFLKTDNETAESVDRKYQEQLISKVHYLNKTWSK